MIRLAGALLLLAAWSACRGSSEPAPPAGAAAEGPDRPETPEDLAEKMRHCPVTLPGTTARLAEIDGGVRFELHASTPDAIAELRVRAHRLADFTAGRDGAAHGGGRGGAFLRHCPIVVKDTRVEAEDVDGGVRITVRPTDAAKLVELRAASRERLQRAMREWKLAGS